MSTLTMIHDDVRPVQMTSSLGAKTSSPADHCELMSVLTQGAVVAHGPNLVAGPFVRFVSFALVSELKD